jgi:hypothetical protein
MGKLVVIHLNHCVMIANKYSICLWTMLQFFHKWTNSKSQSFLIVVDDNDKPSNIPWHFFGSNRACTGFYIREMTSQVISWVSPSDEFISCASHGSYHASTTQPRRHQSCVTAACIDSLDVDCNTIGINTCNSLLWYRCSSIGSSMNIWY